MNKYGVPSTIGGKRNPEYSRALYQANKERMRGYNEAYRQKNRERAQEYTRIYQQKNRERVRAYQRGYTHGRGYESMRIRSWRNQGISIDTYGQFLTLLAIAGYMCEICQIELTESDAHLDHDHDSESIRGVLCNSCNKGIGHFFDSPIVLHRAALYVSEN